MVSLENALMMQEKCEFLEGIEIIEQNEFIIYSTNGENVLREIQVRFQYDEMKWL